MELEKYPLNRIKIPYIPGGTTVYDSTGKSSILEIPTAVSKLLEKGVMEVSLKEIQKQGITVNTGIAEGTIRFVYPQKLQSLVSFVGTLPAHTLVFTNPSENPKNHPTELTNEVYLTEEDVEFQSTEPTTFSAIRPSDSSVHSISRLGHMISFINLQQKKTPFPPSDLRLFLPPVHIASQHAGDCAADSLQTVLFFADFYLEVFANGANEIYKKYIQTDQTVIFNVDDPRLVEEIRERFHVTDRGSRTTDLLFVFASMVRRFILIRLLDFGTPEEIQSLQVPQTTCLLPSAVSNVAGPRQRRKSINILSGVTIARRLSRIFDPKGMFTANKKLMGTEINLMVEHTFYCLLFQIFNIPEFKSIIFDNHLGAPCDVSQITAVLFACLQTKKDKYYAGEEGEGHSISIFRNNDQWYLQDDNIGIAIPMQNFDVEHYFTKQGEFFFRSFEQLPNKTQIIEQRFFTKNDWQKRKPLNYTFYGYDYKDTTGQTKQKICAISNTINYMSEYMSGPTRLILFHGDIDPEKNKKATSSCTAPVKNEAGTRPAPLKVQTIKAVPPTLQEQLLTNYKQGKIQKAVGALEVRALRKNIQNNLNSFTINTRRNNNARSRNMNTRKVRAPTNAEMQLQFTSF
jgi:hypothetical protein